MHCDNSVAWGSINAPAVDSELCFCISCVCARIYDIRYQILHLHHLELWYKHDIESVYNYCMKAPKSFVLLCLCSIKQLLTCMCLHAVLCIFVHTISQCACHVQRDYIVYCAA